VLERHGGDVQRALDDAVSANVHANVERLRDGSTVLRAMLDDGSLRLVGAEYSLESGKVHFLD
jgi:carbonic anhydrase